MQTVREAADRLGRQQMAAKLGVGASTISAAIADGFFPSAWYIALREMTAEKGEVLPTKLFRWKGALEAIA